MEDKAIHAKDIVVEKVINAKDLVAEKIIEAKDFLIEKAVEAKDFVADKLGTEEKVVVEQPVVVREEISEPMITKPLPGDLKPINEF